jgi:hypothetical protein
MPGSARLARWQGPRVRNDKSGFPIVLEFDESQACTSRKTLRQPRMRRIQSVFQRTSCFSRASGESAPEPGAATYVNIRSRWGLARNFLERANVTKAWECHIQAWTFAVHAPVCSAKSYRARTLPRCHPAPMTAFRQGRTHRNHELDSWRAWSSLLMLVRATDPNSSLR